MKRNLPNLDVQFYINPKHTYKEHRLNILKECLVEWTKPETSKFYPFKDSEFRFFVDYIEVNEGEKIAVFHCYTNYNWINDHKLYNDLIGLISFFE